MKCSKHDNCEAFWGAGGQLEHTNARKAAAKPRKAAKRAGGRSRGGRRGGSRTTEARTQTTDVTPGA